MKLKQNPFKQDVLNENNHLLPYHYFNTIVSNGSPDILFHWHPELEINFIHEGSARFHIDYDFFNSQKGDIILVRPNGMHSIHPIGSQEHHMETFQFHLDMIGASIIDQVSLRYLQPLQNSYYKFIYRITSDMEGYDEIKKCLFQIFDLSKKEGRHFELLLKSKINELMYYLYYYKYVIKKSTEDVYRKNEKIRELIDFINNNYESDLSIEKLADFIGYSKTHFMTVFKQHTGTSCTEFVIKVRLSKACELLINSTSPILEIANKIGFNNLSNFNRQFKRYHNMTPSQYRLNYSKPKESMTLINPKN